MEKLTSDVRAIQILRADRPVCVLMHRQHGTLRVAISVVQLLGDVRDGALDFAECLPPSCALASAGFSARLRNKW
jgi:hypothetical protein